MRLSTFVILAALVAPLTVFSAPIPTNQDDSDLDCEDESQDTESNKVNAADSSEVTSSVSFSAVSSTSATATTTTSSASISTSASTSTSTSSSQKQNLDVAILKFADVLNQFEAGFYQAALSKFVDNDFATAGFMSSTAPLEQFIIIQQDETTHSSALQDGLRSLGEEPITSCKFKTDAATKDVGTMTATARVVENLGVSAFLGAAPLVTDPVVLQAAGSILTVEARHQTMLNILSNTGSSIPNAFDLPLSPSEVLAVATPFFDGTCDLGIPANPTLTVTNPGSIAPGTLLALESDAFKSDDSGLFCQFLQGGQKTATVAPVKSCLVPNDIDGPVAIWVTKDSTPLPANSVERDTKKDQLVAGPTLAFVDTRQQMLVQMVRGVQATKVDVKLVQ